MPPFEILGYPAKAGSIENSYAAETGGYTLGGYPPFKPRELTSPLQFNPAFFLDATDLNTLVADGAASLNGTNQYLSAASNTSLQTGNVDFWLSFWFFPTTTGVWTIWAKFFWGGESEYIIKTYSDGSNWRLYFGTHVSGTFYGAIPLSTSVVSFNNWNYGFCYNSTTNRSLYASLNGNAFKASSSDYGQYPAGGIVATTQPSLIGYNQYLGAGYFPGKMDSFAFGKPATGWIDTNATAFRDYLYNGGRGRTSYDYLTSDFFAGSNPSGGVSWWNLDEATGTRFDAIPVFDASLSGQPYYKSALNNLTSNNSVGIADGIAAGRVRANGDPVTTWQDKSENARHFSAAANSFATRPTYKTNQLGTLPAIDIDQADDLLTSPAMTVRGTRIEVTKNGVLVAEASMNNTTAQIGVSSPDLAIYVMQFPITLPTATIEKIVAWLRSKRVVDSWQTLTSYASVWRNRSSLTTFPTLDTRSATSVQFAWDGCTGLTMFPRLNTSNVTDFRSAWNNCSSIRVFPEIDTSKGTLFNSSWSGCSSLTEFPLLNFASATTLGYAWYGCSGLKSFPAITLGSATDIQYVWTGCSGLTSFPALSTGNVTWAVNSWNGCSSLTSFPSLDLSKVQSVQGAWYNCTGLTSFPQLNLSSATNVSSAWFGCSSLTSFPAINLPAATSIASAWQNCTSLTSFPLIDVSNVIGMNTAWGGSGLTSFPALNLSKATSFYQAWSGCTALVNFGQVNSSNVTGFDRAWRDCWALTPFPLIDTSKGQTFPDTWARNYALTSFPSLNFSSATDFTSAWYNCNALATFPANMFDASNCTTYTNAFYGCALTQASVDNILVSISKSAATRNLSSGTLGITSGTSSAPGQAGYYAKAHLVGKGWTVTNNGTDPTPDYSLTGDPGLSSGETWSVGYMKIPKAAVWGFYYN